VGKPHLTEEKSVTPTHSMIPESFVNWSYYERAQLVQRQAAGEKVPHHEIFLGFTRHSPAVVTQGPAGLNASIKGVGFVPQEAYLEEFLKAYHAHIEQGSRPTYREEGLKLLVRLLYGENCAARLDFTRLGSLELARQHTYTNLQHNDQVTLLFYEPPAVSFEVRGRAEIHHEGSPYHSLLNAQHDVFHPPHPELWAERPAYIFHIEQIFDNSATKGGFGRQVY
jgi:hypothetical protein